MTQWYHLARLGVAGCGKSALVGVKWVLVGVWCVWAWEGVGRVLEHVGWVWVEWALVV